MNYFIDTEFIEGFTKPLFGKRRHFIDLISIAIVAEDGRHYYAISNEFNPNLADKWVKENVIAKLEGKNVRIGGPNTFAGGRIWKPNSYIEQDIRQFIQYTGDFDRPRVNNKFYGYYADYDWVLLCSLFGRMIDLPGYMPMYCRDLKQMYDETAVALDSIIYEKIEYKDGKPENAGSSVHDIKTWTNAQKIELLKHHPDYPKQDGEHNALADAFWNKKLYEFLQKI